jgi:hypothetical protein
MEKSGYDVGNIADGRLHCVLVWRKIMFVSLERDKRCVVLSLHPFKLHFLNSVTILCAFWVNYSPPLIRNTCAPNRRGEAFKETNFTHVFLFLMYDVYVTTVPSFIK